MSEDLLYSFRRTNNDNDNTLNFTDQIYNEAFVLLEDELHPLCGKMLIDFNFLTFIRTDLNNFKGLYQKEKNYNVNELSSFEIEEKDGLIEIPNNIGNIVSKLNYLIEKVFPDIINLKNKTNKWLGKRAILTPTNENTL